MILLIGITPTAYPLLPRHLSLADAIAIAVPTFFALAPSRGPWHPAGFAGRAARFAVPAGMISGVGVLASYLFALHDLDYSLAQSRMVATSVLTIVGLYLVYALEGGSIKRRSAVGSVRLALLGAYVAVILLPTTRDFFKLRIPTWVWLSPR